MVFRWVFGKNIRGETIKELKTKQLDHTFPAYDGIQIRVVGTDRLETPAGSFETFVVRRRSRTPDESWRAEQRNWYDPKLGWVLKFEAFDNQGGRERWQVIQLNYPSD